MNLYAIDWLIVLVLIGGLLAIGFYTKRYTRSVADFLAANRCAGRYMLTMADGISSLGAITILAFFEQYYNAGFCTIWWSMMFAPIGLVITLSGWVIYRYRETRAMTLGQFFEMRYSRKFRVFAGVLAWISGVINYGVFPGIVARFFIYFCGIPQKTIYLGSLEIDATLGVVMFILLAIAWMLIFMGGQITVLVTDFFQSQFINFAFIAIVVVLLCKVDLSDVMSKLAHGEPGKSMVNPFDQGKISGFTLSYFAMMAFMGFYTVMAWQGGQGFNCAARNAHEARMARVLGYWRSSITSSIILLLPICVYAILHYNLLPQSASATQEAIASIKGSGWLQQQMTVPIAITHIFPVGLIGVFCAVMIAATLSTDNSYLLSWGSIFVQDVYLPIKNQKPMTPEKHMKMLRMASLGVAAFVWCFSMLFPLNDYIYMYFALTGAIYLGGAGSVIIGGLYWKRSTTAGAWAGMITGSSLSVLGLILKNVLWPQLIPVLKKAYFNIDWLARLPQEFPLNGMEIGFYASLITVVVFVLVSLITKPNPSFSMDKLLHRGKYSISSDHESDEATPKKGWQLFGITDEFSTKDKFIYFGSMFYSFSFVCAVAVIAIFKYVFGLTNEAWGNIWLCYLAYTLLVGLVTTVWFLFGGIRDMRAMFRTLSTTNRDTADDGSVHHGADINSNQAVVDTEKETVKK